MKNEITEKEMRWALFGVSEPVVSAVNKYRKHPGPDISAIPRLKSEKQIIPNVFTSRLRVKLRVGNEFEGRMYEIVHEADTLSSLVAEQEAVKAARKKYRFVEVISVRQSNG
ncbi:MULTISPECIES: hypothetical protein [Pseudomonas fluorescens group]|uniref:Uncharacterized protein n=1 Tax=Pseudomonas synxantha TaxID=47883 RepID=A0A5D3G382_9PSED|nr:MULTISPECIES: hypothetical protein [Pseudomonas fluorescens group]MCK3832697.1 hypothetical protein [Pseudomonas fluorescens]TYK54732.1 hypothetical protein FXO26_25915 [Pseudomonas synxantha]